MRLRRCLPIAVPAAALVVLAQPAHADVDISLIVDSVSEAGYYVDSRAKYFKSDNALDLLRDHKDRHVPVFVAVLPQGESADAVLNGMIKGVQRKGTYAVIVGDTLQVRSDSLPPAQVKTAYTKAVGANRGRPDKALVQFVRLLPRAAQMPPKDPRAVKKPLSETKVEQDKRQAKKQAVVAQKKLAAERKKKQEEGGFPVLPVAGGGVVAVLLAGGGFLFWRRKQATPAPAGAPAPQGPAAAPAGPQATAPEGTPVAGASPGPPAGGLGGAPAPAPTEPQQPPAGGGQGQDPAPGGEQR